MRAITGISLSVLAVAFSVGISYAQHIESNNVWAGQDPNNPVGYTPEKTPQVLADDGTQLDGPELKKTQSDNDTWYTYYEDPLRNYTYMEFCFDKPSNPDTATLNWQIQVDHEYEHVQVFYWHNGNGLWVYLTENNGADPAQLKETDILEAISHSGDTVIFLAVGYTPGGGDWITCDVCDIDCTY